jgi:outer membrane murein-binding lipoprotein Lpp
MDAQRRAEITGWDAREFSDGFSGLRRLVNRDFSGAVTDGLGWLFVFEGRVVGTADADLDAFADASGTVYEAPHESLPVLFAMQEEGGDPRAQYYTNDTPLSEADRKLSQGGFTGYIELSENVLSGDYYVTYTAGESMAAAYVGNSRRLETGDDAFALADDEVGIYTVYEVDLQVQEIPSGDGETETTGAADRDAETEDEADSEQDKRDETATGDDDPETGDEKGEIRVDTNVDDGADVSADEATEPTAGEESSEVGSSAVRAATARPDQQDRTGDRGGADITDDEAAVEPPEGTDPNGSDGTTADRSAGDDVFSEEEQWREQKSIPALDPSEASDPPNKRTDPGGDRQGKHRVDRSRDAGQHTARQAESKAGISGDSGDDGRSPEPRSTGRSAENGSAVSQRSSGPAGGERAERLQQLESALKAAESERESLATERDEIEAERDELAAEIGHLESEVETLREERDRLREELSAARDRLPGGERTMSPADARSGTNLFVRYDSKGGATLEDVHDGGVDRDALRENLRIEHHTSFETDGLVVDGRPYEEFLTDTIEYGFTRWLVEDLPFEVSGTGNQSVLRDLYDALPEIDRAEIGGSASIVIRENGEETREQRAFDLVLRDRMGNPLFVADLNDSRDPTAEGTLESLVGDGRDIAESNDSFAAAFAVTESFFEPGALETASDAVGGGLFSRSKRASFVKLSRKRGYHLCLVEARDGGFHMTVPDL